MSLVVCDLLQGLDGQEPLPGKGKSCLSRHGVKLVVRGKRAEDVALGRGSEPLLALIRCLSGLRGHQEGRPGSEQGREGECLVSQSQRATVDHQFTQPRIRWQLREQLAQRGEMLIGGCERADTPQILYRVVHRRGLRGFGKPGAHRLGVTFEVESLDPHNQLLQAHAPHLWVCVPVHSLERVRGEEVESNTWSDASSATTSLLGRRGGHGDVIQGAHESLRVVSLLLHASGVDDADHVVNRD